MKYKQCCLQKKIEQGTENMVSWIPTEYVKVGHLVSLKIKEEWEDGWKIISAGESIDGKLIENQAHNSNDIWKPSSLITNRGNK
jgi:hypothetical protein